MSLRPSQPLPSIGDPKVQGLEENGRNVWVSILAAQKWAQQVTKSSTKAADNRLIGFPFLLTAYNRLLLEIKSCMSPMNEQAHNEKICELGLLYRNYLMRVFRSNAGPVPVASEHPSRPSFDRAKERIVDLMKVADPSESDIKKLALVRDNFQCMLSGSYDQDTFRDHPEFRDHVLSVHGDLGRTQCAHLFPESAQDSNKDPRYATTALIILKMFGLGDLVDEILGGKVNSLANVLTMHMELHDLFDTFQIWLEPVEGQEPGDDSCYEICSYDKTQLEILRSIRGCPTRIRFQINPEFMLDCQMKGGPTPVLPDRRLIALRAACARVANMAGAAEQADQYLDDWKEIRVLADDGSSAEALSSMLLLTPEYVATYA